MLKPVCPQDFHTLKARALRPRQCFGYCGFIRKACGFKFDLVFGAVDGQVAIHVVGHAILVPLLTSVLGDPLLKGFALVLAACENIGRRADVGGAHVHQAVAGDGVHPDAQLAGAAMGSAFPVHANQPLRQVVQVDGVNLVIHQEADDVGGRGGGGFVGVQQVLHGVAPLSHFLTIL